MTDPAAKVASVFPERDSANKQKANVSFPVIFRRAAANAAEMVNIMMEEDFAGVPIDDFQLSTLPRRSIMPRGSASFERRKPRMFADDFPTTLSGLTNAFPFFVHPVCDAYTNSSLHIDAAVASRRVLSDDLLAGRIAPASRRCFANR